MTLMTNNKRRNNALYVVKRKMKTNCKTVKIFLFDGKDVALVPLLLTLKKFSMLILL